MNEDAKRLLLKLKEMKSCALISRIDRSSEGENKVLGLLYETKENLSAGEISSLLHLTTARVAVILSSLEEKAMIRKLPDANDRRRTMVEITEKGRQHVEKMYHELSDCMDYLVEHIGSEKMNAFVDTLKEICTLAEETIDGK